MRVSQGIKRAVTAVAAGAVLLSAVPAGAQSQEWVNLRNTLLTRASELMTAQGFYPIGFAHDGSLNDDGQESVTVSLVSGRETMLVGICDGDCSDLDLTLYDPSGNQIVADVATDDVPIVRATPKSVGFYRVTVTMAVCTVNPCRYAIQAYTK